MKKISLLLIIVFFLNGCNLLKNTDVIETNDTEEVEQEEFIIREIEDENIALEKKEDDDYLIEEVDESLKIREKLGLIDYYVGNLEDDYLEYKGKNSEYSLEKVILDVNIGLNKPFYEGIYPSKNPFQLDVICNKYNALPDDFKPENLVTIETKYYINDGKEYLINERLLTAYKRMYEAAINDGLNLKIASAYRSKDFQAYLYNKYKNNHGQEEADTFSARPRHSEHETGLAIDFYPISNSFEEKEEFKWLMENAHNYGFILRYPKDKEYITGYMYEPWHFRFIGEDIAIKVVEENITYDQYYAKYILPKNH